MVSLLISTLILRENALRVIMGYPTHLPLPSNSRLEYWLYKHLESGLEILTTLRRAKNIIFPYIDKCTPPTQKFKGLENIWETLTTVDRILSHLERAEAVSRFHLTTVHEIMVVYIHWLDLNASAAMSGWMVSTYSKKLDSKSTRHMTSSPYLEAWYQIAKKPSMAVG
ncbi:hypothetical protein TNCV_964701 [Trichonephila clavipes]|nr:hypothetical protein TNCV_964701 [Trichonephila clavipes]